MDVYAGANDLSIGRGIYLGLLWVSLLEQQLPQRENFGSYFSEIFAFSQITGILRTLFFFFFSSVKSQISSSSNNLYINSWSLSRSPNYFFLFQVAVFQFLMRWDFLLFDKMLWWWKMLRQWRMVTKFLLIRCKRSMLEKWNEWRPDSNENIIILQMKWLLFRGQNKSHS